MGSVLLGGFSVKLPLHVIRSVWAASQQVYSWVNSPLCCKIWIWIAVHWHRNFKKYQEYRAGHWEFWDAVLIHVWMPIVLHQIYGLLTCLHSDNLITVNKYIKPSGQLQVNSYECVICFSEMFSLLLLVIQPPNTSVQHSHFHIFSWKG